MPNTANARETLCYSQMSSPVGDLVLVASEMGLVAIAFGPSGLPRQVGNARLLHELTALRNCENQLRAYFAGELKEFSVALDLRGTEFQRLCWRALLDIPYGETRSYADLARSLGRPNAFRAVGMANHDNPIPIVVPCHRVLAADGSLCGYGGGLDVKAKLLELERAVIRGQASLPFAAG